MSEESGTQEFAAAWKNQPEEIPVRLDGFMNRRGRELHSATRSEIMMSIAAVLFFVAVMAWRFAMDRSHIPQLGFIASIAWALISLYWFRDRMRREDPARKDAMAVTCVEYYRRELERRRDHLRNAWLWHGPLFLSCTILVMILIGNQYPAFRGLSRVLPLVLLLAVWTGFGFVRRRRQTSELQQEIDDVSQMISD